MDRSFLIPKSIIYINFFSPYMRTVPKDSFCIQIFFNYLHYIFDTAFGDARDAGNDIDITSNEK